MCPHTHMFIIIYIYWFIYLFVVVCFRLFVWMTNIKHIQYADIHGISPFTASFHCFYWCSAIRYYIVHWYFKLTSHTKTFFFNDTLTNFPIQFSQAHSVYSHAHNLIPLKIKDHSSDNQTLQWQNQLLLIMQPHFNAPLNCFNIKFNSKLNFYSIKSFRIAITVY